VRFGHERLDERRGRLAVRHDEADEVVAAEAVGLVRSKTEYGSAAFAGDDTLVIRQGGPGTLI
jgi:hypothetical protein